MLSYLSQGERRSRSSTRLDRRRRVSGRRRRLRCDTTITRTPEASVASHVCGEARAPPPQAHRNLHPIPPAATDLLPLCLQVPQHELKVHTALCGEGISVSIKTKRSIDISIRSSMSISVFFSSPVVNYLHALAGQREDDKEHSRHGEHTHREHAEVLIPPADPAPQHADHQAR